jgi:RNA polymerase sigma factor (sigma-70 family)
MENLEQHFPLVWSIARKYAAYRGETSPDDSEAYAEGLFWLASAAKSFDPDRGVKFSTYAFHVINYGLIGWMKLGRTQRLNQFAEHVDPVDSSAESYPFDSVEKLRSSVDLFDGRLRDIVAGRIDGLTWKQIGERVGCSKQAAEQLFTARGLPRLRAAFGVS